jgi:hypothetical protein
MRNIASKLSSAMEAFMPITYLWLVHCFVRIRLLKHGKCLCWWFLQQNTKFDIHNSFSYRHFQRDLACCYSVRGYKMAILFLSWRRRAVPDPPCSNSSKLDQRIPVAYWSYQIRDSHAMPSRCCEFHEIRTRCRHVVVSSVRFARDAVKLWVPWDSHAMPSRCCEFHEIRTRCRHVVVSFMRFARDAVKLLWVPWEGAMETVLCLRR